MRELAGNPGFGGATRPEELNEVYSEYYDKLKDLPYSPSKGEIEVDYFPYCQLKGMNAAPDYLIDKKVNTAATNVFSRRLRRRIKQHY